jgi:hypothetical protein
MHIPKKKETSSNAERKSYLSIKSKDFFTIDSIKSQGLDAFCVEGSTGIFMIQRMGQIHIVSSGNKKYKHLKCYRNQTRLMFHGVHKVIRTKTQTLENFVIKAKEKPKNFMERPVDFEIEQKPKKKIFTEEQLDYFMLDKKEKPPLIAENINSVMFEKEKRPNNRIEKLKQINLPATGKFFNNMPVLKLGKASEFEYLKIKPPFLFESLPNLFLPLKPKKIRYTNLDVKSESSSNLLYIINKVKIFSPSSTQVKSESSLLIPEQPKKTSFNEITVHNVASILYNIPRKIKPFEEVSISSYPDIFLPEQPKKHYYSATKAESMSIKGTPVFCLEIDPNEEIYIENVYDMLLIQNVWDDLSIDKYRLCLRPKGYIGRSSKNLSLFIKPNLGTIEEKEKENEDANENKDEKNNEQEQEKDKIKEGNESHKDNNSEINTKNNDNNNNIEGDNKDNVKENDKYVITINYVDEPKDKNENISEEKK